MRRKRERSAAILLLLLFSSWSGSGMAATHRKITSQTLHPWTFCFGVHGCDADFLRSHHQRPTAQQQRFLAARAAIRRGDLARAERLREGLADYPLSPYLDIWLAWRRMNEGDDGAVPSLLARYREIPESWDLHLAWIRDLARRGQWPAVAAEIERFPAASVRLPETAMRAAFYAGKPSAALQRFSRFWQRGKRIDDVLRPLEQAWRRRGHPTGEERWARVLALGDDGRWREAARIARPLPAMERQLLRRWREGRERVSDVLASWPQPAVASIHEAQILSRLLRRLSRRRPLLAWRRLKRLERAFTDRERNELKRKLALRAARRQLLPAAAWLAALPAAFQNDETRGWRVRLLLQQRDWPGVLEAIAAMPPEQRRRPEWGYWQARALEAIGARKGAALLYAALARGRGYFAFLSAERAGLDYALQDHPPPVDRRALERIRRLPGVRRARAWLLLREEGKARREWGEALRRLSPREWRAAALLAARWGWHDRTIAALIRAGAYDALSLRFPLAYRPIVQRLGEESGLSPSLIWSVARVESAFNPRAGSPKGGLGLMQLLPRTARMVARRLGRTPPKREQLFDPATNLRLGTHYLSAIHARFGGRTALTAAAYNAGPKRVSRWLARQPYDDGEIWVASIPFRETRRYVQRVLAYSVVYDWRRGVRPVALSRRLNGPLHLARR